MTWALVLALLILVIIAGGIIFYLSQSSKNNQLSSLLNSQRNVSETEDEVEYDELGEVIKKAKKKRKITSQLSLEKRLKFANWKIPPFAYYWLMFVISLVSVFITYNAFSIVVVFFSVFVGPLFMSWLLAYSIDRRFRAFDVDYSSFLLNVVSMLRIGMNVVTALQAAAEGLNPGSMVKEEVEIMVERLKLGVSEEKSIGSFGESVYHPEIELFVQAVILSRRLGGNLSDTLDRLAGQVRKRQQFRMEANAAVGMQRGSIWIIIGIMVGVETFLCFTSPDLVIGAIKDPIGWQIWQGAILVMIIGVYWVRQVTKLKI